MKMKVMLLLGRTCSKFIASNIFQRILEHEWTLKTKVWKRLIFPTRFGGKQWEIWYKPTKITFLRFYKFPQALSNLKLPLKTVSLEVSAKMFQRTEYLNFLFPLRPILGHFPTKIWALCVKVTLDALCFQGLESNKNQNHF